MIYTFQTDKAFPEIRLEISRVFDSKEPKFERLLTYHCMNFQNNREIVANLYKEVFGGSISFLVKIKKIDSIRL